MNIQAKNLIPIVQLTDSEEQVKQALQICNACRYCETFCAVFPAMTKRLEFNEADIHYLANLCHNCGAYMPVNMLLRMNSGSIFHKQWLKYALKPIKNLQYP